MLYIDFTVLVFLRFMGPPRGPDFYRNQYAVTDVIEFGALNEVEEELKVLFA